ncbi:putative non-specific lipid-transfer protein 14 [Arachis duranensis]|uniref:Non-specific lipid-transfer protein 14 n=1 Tax=Arachis duranensis TaxID=130453 RepID=A0A6P5MNI0_ARADU|nr:putative non-specific lipid-transfer protein 14 [Arachis duranensis]XP_057734662.1 putative non-specific lipid-transfer protein 14 [Arachis stenosperma]
MESYKAMIILLAVMLMSYVPFAPAVIDCPIVNQLFSACSIFITYGSPDPMPGTPCCDAMSGLNIIANANSGDNRQSVCRCLMGLIETYNPNATAIGTLPGLCGVSLGFTIDPNTNCGF